MSQYVEFVLLAVVPAGTLVWLDRSSRRVKHHRLSNWLFMRRYRATHPRPERRTYPHVVRPDQSAIDASSRSLTRAGVDGALIHASPGPLTSQRTPSISQSGSSPTLVGAVDPRTAAPTRPHRRLP
jgi:hypothetical protein